MRLSEPLKACNVCAFHFILNKRGALRSGGAVTPPGPGVGQRLLVQALGGGRGGGATCQIAVRGGMHDP